MGRLTEAFRTLATFTFNETLPFAGDVAEGVAEDLVEEAHALLIVYGTLFDEQPDGEMPIRHVHLSKALNGIGSLLALSAFINASARGDR